MKNPTKFSIPLSRFYFFLWLFFRFLNLKTLIFFSSVLHSITKKLLLMFMEDLSFIVLVCRRRRLELAWKKVFFFKKTRKCFLKSRLKLYFFYLVMEWIERHPSSSSSFVVVPFKISVSQWLTGREEGSHRRACL